jgi:hypothetical protein
VDAHTFTKQAKKVQTNTVCQKADDYCLLGQDRSTDSEINTRDHNKIIDVLQNTEKLRRAIQNKTNGIVTSSTVFLHNNVHPHTVACTQTARAFQLGAVCPPSFQF